MSLTNALEARRVLGDSPLIGAVQKKTNENHEWWFADRKSKRGGCKWDKRAIPDHSSGHTSAPHWTVFCSAVEDAFAEIDR